MKDCVATTPTPASAQVTSAPTANQCDCTATPISPVAGSRATIENVCTGRSVRTGAGSFCAAALTAKSTTPKKIRAMRFTVPPDEMGFSSHARTQRCLARQNEFMIGTRQPSIRRLPFCRGRSHVEVHLGAPSLLGFFNAELAQSHCLDVRPGPVPRLVKSFAVNNPRGAVAADRGHIGSAKDQLRPIGGAQ